MTALTNVKLSSKSALCFQDHQKSHQNQTMKALTNVKLSSMSALCPQDHHKSPCSQFSSVQFSHVLYAARGRTVLRNATTKIWEGGLLKQPPQILVSAGNSLSHKTWCLTSSFQCFSSCAALLSKCPPPATWCVMGKADVSHSLHGTYEKFVPCTHQEKGHPSYSLNRISWYSPPRNLGTT